MVLSDRLRGNGHKLKHEMFPLNIRIHFVTEHEDGFPREPVESLSLEILKRFLNMVLGRLSLGGSARAGRLG